MFCFGFCMYLIEQTLTIIGWIWASAKDEYELQPRMNMSFSQGNMSTMVRWWAKEDIPEKDIRIIPEKGIKLNSQVN